MTDTTPPDRAIVARQAGERPLSDEPGRVPVPEDPRDLPGLFRFRRDIEVRFRDTDAMGHVNNAEYLTYVEIARASYYQRVTGAIVGVGAWDEERSFILAESRVVYRSPAYFGETLTVEARTSRIGRSSFTLEYRITAPASTVAPERLIAVADSVQVMYQYETATVMPLPADLVALVEAYEGRPLRD